MAVNKIDKKLELIGLGGSITEELPVELLRLSRRRRDLAVLGRFSEAQRQVGVQQCHEA
jgi:hypothetical protein